MANIKLLLFVLFFLLATLIGEDTAEALQDNKSIDQAIALIDNAIDEALAQVKESIDEDPAQAGETINEALALIEDAINEATALIEETIEEEHTSAKESVEEDLYSAKEEINEATALIEETIEEEHTSAKESVEEDLSSAKESVEEDLYSAKEAINRDIQEAIETVASRLSEDDFKLGLDEVTRLEETDFAGSIAAGMVSAYELIGDSTYKISAEMAGKNILSTASGNFKGDEVFALARLSQISSTSGDNLWWTAVSDFYRNVQNGVDGTEGYISQFADAGPSTAVFHLAYYVITAYYVDAEDKQIWRRALINYIAQVDDDCSDSPVMALGMSTWALARTGPLDDTLIDASGTAVACWGHKKLKDLPELLLSQQVPDGEPYAGSFYRRFDHGDGGAGGLSSGYIEDAIFATLGLIGAFRDHPPSEELESAILAAWQAILDAIDATGRVCHHPEPWCLDCHCVHTAEMLQVLGELIIPGDLNSDGCVDLIDVALSDK